MAASLPYDNDCVSIITCASSLAFAKNVFSNYMQQDICKKELIIVHNNSRDDFEQWLDQTRLYPMVRIYQQDPGTPVGDCINYCMERSIYENIALFHEEHYYGPLYLSGCIRDLYRTQADLVGKRTYYTLAAATGQPVLHSPGYENGYTDFVILPTFLFKRTLSDTLRFDSSSAELDKTFCGKLINAGGRIFSTDHESYLFRSLPAVPRS
jgi:hypothetical protein